MNQIKCKLVSIFLGSLIFLGTMIYRTIFIESPIEDLVTFIVATIGLLMIIVPLYFKTNHYDRD